MNQNGVQQLDRNAQGMAMWMGVFKEVLERRINAHEGIVPDEEIDLIKAMADKAQRVIHEKVEELNTRLSLGVR